MIFPTAENSKIGRSATVSDFTPGFPETFYKYRTWSDENHQRILRNNEIYFASGNDFNDPFDCDIRLRYDLLPKDEMRERMEINIRGGHPEMKRRERRKLINVVYKQKRWKDPSHVRWVQEQVADKIGIFSASARRDSVLMWSHYADSHRGFCVGFSTSHFSKFCNAIPSRGEVPIIVQGRIVGYRDEYPLIIPRMQDIEEYVYTPMNTKAKEWQYEQELRFFAITGGARFSLEIPKAVITEVILGCAMVKEQVMEIQEVLVNKLSHVKLYQAEKKEGAFALDFRELTYP